MALGATAALGLVSAVPVAWVYATQPGVAGYDAGGLGWEMRLRMGLEAVQGIVGKVWPFVLIGIAVGAAIHGWVPENFMARIMGKGAALGTVLAFMMAVIGLSLPETIILRKVLRPRLIAVFLGVVSVGIIVVGYLFNWLTL